MGTALGVFHRTSRTPVFPRAVFFWKPVLLALVLMPATWIEIAEADVLTVLAGPELAAYREAALADGQADPVQPAIDAITEDVRGYVAGCAKNTLGPDGTIPKRLLRDALALIAVDIPGRVGKTPKDVRKTKAAEALEKLKLVARCQYAIADPSDDQEASTEASPAPAPSFAGRDRRDARSLHRGM